MNDVPAADLIASLPACKWCSVKPEADWSSTRGCHIIQCDCIVLYATASLDEACRRWKVVQGIRDRHWGDCSIYDSMVNGSPEDGICTCGYGWSLVSEGDLSQMYSEERQQSVKSSELRMNAMAEELERVKAERDDLKKLLKNFTNLNNEALDKLSKQLKCERTASSEQVLAIANTQAEINRLKAVVAEMVDSHQEIIDLWLSGEGVLDKHGIAIDSKFQRNALAGKMQAIATRALMKCSSLSGTKPLENEIKIACEKNRKTWNDLTPEARNNLINEGLDKIQKGLGGWISVKDRLPEVKEGDCDNFIVMLKCSDGKVRVSGEAFFLNRYELGPDNDYEPKPEDEYDEENMTMKWSGWCWMIGEFEEEKFLKIKDHGAEVIMWMPLPQIPLDNPEVNNPSTITEGKDSDISKPDPAGLSSKYRIADPLSFNKAMKEVLERHSPALEKLSDFQEDLGGNIIVPTVATSSTLNPKEIQDQIEQLRNQNIKLRGEIVDLKEYRKGVRGNMERLKREKGEIHKFIGSLPIPQESHAHILNAIKFLWKELKKARTCIAEFQKALSWIQARSFDGAQDKDCFACKSVNEACQRLFIDSPPIKKID